MDINSPNGVLEVGKEPHQLHLKLKYRSLVVSFPWMWLLNINLSIFQLIIFRELFCRC